MIPFFSSYFQFWLAWDSLGYDGSDHICICGANPPNIEIHRNKQICVYLTLVDTFINLGEDRDIMNTIFNIDTRFT